MVTSRCTLAEVRDVPLLRPPLTRAGKDSRKFDGEETGIPPLIADMHSPGGAKGTVRSGGATILGISCAVASLCPFTTPRW